MMTRLQKKCFIASLAFHGLLILVLLFGAALMPEPQESNFKPIKFYDPSKVSDLLTSGGAESQAVPSPQQTQAKPPAAQPSPTPPAPKPLPEPPAPRRVEVPKPAEEPQPKIVEKSADHWYEFKWTKSKTEPKPDVAKDEPTEKPTKHKIVLDSADLKPKARAHDEAAKAELDSEAKNERRRAAREFAAAYRSLSKNLSTSTLVDMPSDAGPAGEASVNYRDIIASKYYNAWIAPSELDDTSTPVVIARVTIARSGDVVSAHVIQSSGNAAMDRSIENVLQTVTFIEPFPAGSQDQERTVTIKFNLQTKREIG